jgi:hypothetical protein
MGNTSLTRVYFWAVQHKSGLNVVHQQESGVEFMVVLHSEIDERSMGNIEVVDQITDDAIVGELREEAKLGLSERGAAVFPSAKLSELPAYQEVLPFQQDWLHPPAANRQSTAAGRMISRYHYKEFGSPIRRATAHPYQVSVPKGRSASSHALV